MAYSTQSDIQEEVTESVLIELTDDERLGVINAARVTKAITAADKEIDSYLAQRYPVPMTTGLDLLKDCSANLALERLYLRRTGSLPSDRKDRIAAVRKLLADIAAGRASLGVTPAPTEEGGGTFSAGERKFTRNKLTDF